ncbi:hypothetical protein ACFLZG_04610, partial [Thermodesulfobacteriota bacterium]
HFDYRNCPRKAHDWSSHNNARHLWEGCSDCSSFGAYQYQIPTYYKVNECGTNGQLRIEYWWFYAWQQPCTGPWGSHPADWEHIIVITSEDRAEVAGVTYFQHKGWYTRTFRHGKPKDFATIEDHPVVYVGKTQHGSYYNRNTSGIQTCLYYGDLRNPGIRENWYWRTWKTPLVNLRSCSVDKNSNGIGEPDKDEFSQPWMKYDKLGGWYWGWRDGETSVGTHPTTRHDGDFCRYSPCDGKDSFGTYGCRDSSCMFGSVGHYDCGLKCHWGKTHNCDTDTYAKDKWLYIKTGLPYNDTYMICEEENCRCKRRRANPTVCP